MALLRAASEAGRLRLGIGNAWEPLVCIAETALLARNSLKKPRFCGN